MSDSQGPNEASSSDFARVRGRLAGVAASFLMRYDRPPRVAIVGMPGVGKSRLLNRLVGATVSPISADGHATRRPVSAFVEGVTFVDTPSLRAGDSTDSDLDPEVIEADIVLHLINATSRITDRDLEVIAKVSERSPVVIALNKMDALTALEADHVMEAAKICLSHHRVDPVPISGKAGTGLVILLERICGRLERYKPPKRTSREEGPSADTVRSDGQSSLAMPVALYGLGAALGVILVARSSLPIPFLDVAVVAATQYLLIGHIIGRHARTVEGIEVLRLVATALGGVAYFLLSGKFRWIFPTLGQLLDALAALLTTTVFGYAVEYLLVLADRLFPPWLLKLVLGRIRKGGSKSKTEDKR